jgi:hypothetical protein
VFFLLSSVYLWSPFSQVGSNIDEDQLMAITKQTMKQADKDKDGVMNLKEFGEVGSVALPVDCPSRLLIFFLIPDSWRASQDYVCDKRSCGQRQALISFTYFVQHPL